MAPTREPSFRERLLKHKSYPVSLPGIGEGYIRVMTLAEATAWRERAAAREKEQKSILETLLMYTLSDKEGNRIFKDDEEELIATEVEWPIIKTLFDESCKINKLNPETPQETAQQAKN